MAPSSMAPAYLLLLFGTALIVFRFSQAYYNQRVFRQKHFLQTLNNLSNQIPWEKIHNDQDFNKFANALHAMAKPPYLILYDSSNLDVVLNHICNLKHIPNALNRLVAIAFDEDAFHALRREHQFIPLVLIDLKPLIRSLSTVEENRGYLVYTLTLLVHAKICACLAYRRIDFWSMHQDTLWTKNFESMNVEDRYPDANLLFDTIGNEYPFYHRMRNWVCGATFFVRGSPITYQFFRQFLPLWMVSSFNYFEGPRDNVPVLIQLDGGKKKGETKMDVLRKGHFVFRHQNGTCNSRTFFKLRKLAKYGYPEVIPENGSLQENWIQRTTYFIKNMLNIDPWNRKFYLTIHQSLI